MGWAKDVWKGLVLGGRSIKACWEVAGTSSVEDAGSAVDAAILAGCVSCFLHKWSVETAYR